MWVSGHNPGHLSLPVFELALSLGSLSYHLGDMGSAIILMEPCHTVKVKAAAQQSGTRRSKVSLRWMKYCILTCALST